MKINGTLENWHSLQQIPLKEFLVISDCFSKVFQQDNCLHLTCHCGHRQSMPKSLKSRNVIKALKSILAAKIYIHLCIGMTQLQFQQAQLIFQTVNQCAQALQVYNKRFVISQELTYTRVTCAICGYHTAQSHFNSITKSYGRLVVFNLIYKHFQETHFRFLLKYRVENSRQPFKGKYLYLDSEWKNCFDSKQNILLVHMAFFQNLRFSEPLSYQFSSTDSKQGYFRFVDFFETVQEQKIKNIIINKLIQADNKLLVKDGKLQILLFAQLALNVALTVRDLGGTNSLGHQNQPLKLNSFRGNHLNLKKELQHYQNQLTQKKQELCQREGWTKGIIFSMDWCNLYLKSENEWLMVSADRYWKEADSL